MVNKRYLHAHVSEMTIVFTKLVNKQENIQLPGFVLKNYE